MRKKINVQRHVVALILTLAFFVIGILIGGLLTNERLRYLQDKSAEQSIDFESLQTQYLYVSLFKENQSCPVVAETFAANVKNLEDTRKELESFIRRSQINQHKYDLLKRQYIIAQIRYWLLAQSTQKVCDRDIVTVLYFFSNPTQCPDCGSQGVILTYLKKIFGDQLLIFSFDGDLDREPFIPILKKVYNLTAYPTLIIEGSQYRGLQKKDELLKEICKRYKNEYAECKGV